MADRPRDPAGPVGGPEPVDGPESPGGPGPVGAAPGEPAAGRPSAAEPSAAEPSGAEPSGAVRPGEPVGPPGSAEPPGAEPVVRVPRLRSPRTAAAAAVAVVVLLLAGALLYDVVAVRVGQDARRWRAALAEDLATRPLDDAWVLLGAVAAVLLGGWLLWLAFAPGLARWLPLRPNGGTSAAIDRDGVGTLLVDRAGEIPGIEHITVKINRSRVRVVVTGPVDPALVQRQLRDELTAVGLARPLRLDVRSAGHRSHEGAARG